MSLSGDLGISPVLLQAISSLTSSEGRQDKVPVKQERPSPRKMDNHQTSSKVVSHLLQGMNEPVSGLLAQSSSPSDLGQESDRLAAQAQKQEEVLLNAAIQERLASHLVMNQNRVITTTPAGNSVSAADVSMVNVLTALASQHMKANIKQEDSDAFTTIAHPTTATPTGASVVVRSSGDLQDDRPQPQIIIYYNNESGGSVPSPGNDVIVGELEGDGVQGSIQNYRVVMHHGDVASARVTAVSEQTVTEAAAAAVAATASPGTFVSGESNCAPDAAMTGNCPICGDKLSGYHYGVFTCESCKGFFKRTVQNKKSFQCHKTGECDINIYNRKKCPACRFSKCLNAGMRLEAIRQDRTRGGRSSYDGCSPHGKPRPSPLQRKVKRPSVGTSDEDSKVVAAPVLPGVDLFTAGEEGRSHRQLVAILNHSRPGQQAPDGEGQRVPELLTDIMNLEALLADDDIPQEGAAEDPNSEQAFYNYLMQLTELRLYKLVRWARNLPQFGAISTDDQIILLQNCWSDLLALGVCWRSISTPNVLSISTTRSISLQQAEALGFGDVVGRLLNMTQNLRRLHVDQYEYVALKVLLLITPDVKGLKEPSKIHEYQEKLSEALMEYTSTHYAQMPSKFGEMLLRLPELARISFIAKEILLVALPPTSPSCGLLVELLKGENAVKD
ncbi:nuclear hormone receptor FTZ-F1 beta-like isoform X2 [Littorina saxatilis]|uniref:Uncharacterized protein n=1 Tax=Littorina saxatilis TaxID=31220 RepID=A0AAN9AWU8_9CAEN